MNPSKKKISHGGYDTTRKHALADTFLIVYTYMDTMSNKDVRCEGSRA